MASKDPYHVHNRAYKYALQQACESSEYSAIGLRVAARLRDRVPKRTGSFASSIRVKKTPGGHWASDIYIGTKHPLAFPIEYGHPTRGPNKKGSKKGSKKVKPKHERKWVDGSHTFHDFVARGGK